MYFDPFGLAALTFGDYVRGAMKTAADAGRGAAVYGASVLARTNPMVPTSALGVVAADAAIGVRDAAVTRAAAMDLDGHVSTGDVVRAGLEIVTGAAAIADGVVGVNPVTGEELSTSDRVASVSEGVGVGLSMAVGGGAAGATARHVVTNTTTKTVTTQLQTWNKVWDLTECRWKLIAGDTRRSTSTHTVRHRTTVVEMEPNTGAGGKATGYTRHGLNQAIGRDSGVGVAPRAILDAVKNPARVIQQTDGRVKYIGKDATVILNESGQVITTWPNAGAAVRGAGGGM